MNKSGRLSGRWRQRRNQVADERADRAAERVADRRQDEQPAAAGAEPPPSAESDERLRERIAQQWSELRASRHHQDDAPVITAGPSNLSRAEVPWAVDLAAAWAWRFVVIVIAGGIILYLIQFFAVIALPLVIALLISALAAPVVSLIHHVGVPRKLAALIVVVGGLAVIALLLTFIGTQVAQGIDNLSQQVVDGLGQIRGWLQNGPLHASDSQINDVIKNAQDVVSKRGNDLVGQATELGSAIGHILAGFFIILFATYFFLADGQKIWAWLVRLFPRAARLRADSSGRVAWVSLTQFVRATVLVAGTDAIGIMIFAAVLKVPFVSAIGVLVFLGAFIPLIGATLSGAVAVLVALVAHGPIVALIMLGGVVLIQQIEAHVLQPFLMGRFVSVHPLGVIVAIAMGVIVAGIPGALIAVPLAAALNAVVQHLATYTVPGEDSLQAAAEDPQPDPLLTADAAREASDS